MNLLNRFLIMSFVAVSPTATASEQKPITRGITEEAKRQEIERPLAPEADGNVILHLRNDTDGRVVFRAAAGDCTSGKAVLRAEHVLVESGKFEGATPLVNWLQRGIVFRSNGSIPSLSYVAQPGEEFDVVITANALSDPKDPQSTRKPLQTGSYRVFLDLQRVEDLTSGLALPLLSYIIQIP